MYGRLCLMGKILWSDEQRCQQNGATAIALHRTGMEQAMADLERTNAGWQLLIAGCDKRTLPRSTTPVDDHGQGLLGYFTPPSDSEVMQRKLAAPLRGR
jgi:hypothetical protein